MYLCCCISINQELLKNICKIRVARPYINNDLQKALTDQILTPEFSHLQKCLGESITTTVIKTLRLLKTPSHTHTENQTPKLYAGH